MKEIKSMDGDTKHTIEDLSNRITIVQDTSSSYKKRHRKPLENNV